MDSKTQFISSKELAAWWGSVSNDERFDRVLLYASGVAFEGVASSEQREGILRFKEILMTLASAEAPPVKFVSPGLNHDLEPQRRIVQPPENQPTKTSKKK